MKRNASTHLPVKPGCRLSIEAEDLDDRGFGIGWTRGVEIRTADLLPGERAELTIEHVSSHRARAWGRIVHRLGPPAPTRVAPACSGFGRCGGCAWQHLAYDAQLIHKRRQLAQTLTAAGLEVAVAPILGATATSGYRNYGKYVVGTGEHGPILGAYAPRTHEVVDTAGCCVVEPVIDETSRAVRLLLGESVLRPYNERQKTGDMRYVLIRSGSDGQVVVGLVTTSRAPRAAVVALAAALMEHRAVAGVVWIRNDSHNGVLVARDTECLAGVAHVVENLAGIAVAVGLGDFFQINRVQAARLYTLVAAESGVLQGTVRRAIDLYCGVGGIAFALAAAGAQVLGIEVNPSAVHAANAAAKGTDLCGRVAFCAGDAASVMALGAGFGADLIAVNPPRQGLNPATRAALIHLRPQSLVYVSCGPASLARDLTEMCAAGWRIARVQPIDLMPGTPHLETVVVLDRALNADRGRD